MIKTLRLLFTGLIILLLFNSCKNDIMTEVETSACTPFISNPRLDWYSLNDCNLSSGGDPASVFYVLMDVYGGCIDDSTVYTVTINSYDAAGVKSDVPLSFGQTAFLLGDQARIGVCLRFGFKETVYSKVDIQCTTKNGKNSNTVSIILNRPKGAN
jgi:hypothetical protein